MPAAVECNERSGIGHIFDLLLMQLANPAEFELPNSFNLQNTASTTIIKRNIFLNHTELEDIGNIFELLVKHLKSAADFELPDWLSAQKPASDTSIRGSIHYNHTEHEDIGNIFELLVKHLESAADFELPDWFSAQKPASDASIRGSTHRNFYENGVGCIGNLFDTLLKQLGTPVEFELPDCLHGMMPTPCSSIKESIKQNCTELSSIGNIFDMLRKQLENPAEFELPDWLAKWKPLPYKSIKRNIYLTKKIKRRQEYDGIFCSCTPASGSNSVCGRYCHCWMLLSSCSSGCKCGSLCKNKPFQYRAPKKMKLVQTDKCGSGIVAEEDIKKGEFIIEYVGEVIDDKTCEERLWKMKHRGETNFYLCEINRDMVIDATYKGNKSRYMNHSCCPNTEMQKWSIDGETRIGIFATRNIKMGEQLTYDYQFVQFGADQNCYCGAASCRKKLGVKPSKLKMSPPRGAFKHFVGLTHQNEGVHGGIAAYQTSCHHNCIGEVIRINRVIRGVDLRSVDPRRWLFGIIKQFDCVSKTHLIMYEDGSCETLDMSKQEWEFA